MRMTLTIRLLGAMVCGAMLLALAACFGADEPRAGGLPIAFSIEKPGRVSVGVFDRQGVLVRTLCNARPMEAGAHILHWDGLDLEGRPVPRGEYVWKLLQSQGLQAEYLMALGTNSGLDHWPGQHNGPVCVACDGRSVIVGGAPEGSPLMAKVGLDGKFDWNLAQFRAPEGAVDLSIDGDRVYTLQNSAMVDVLQTVSGERVTGIIATGTQPQPLAYRLVLPVRKLDAIAATADESRKIEVAVGDELPYLIRQKYLVRMLVGQNEKSDTVIGCKINGQWFGSYGLKPGAQMEMLGPSAYGTPQPIESANGKLVMEFSFKASQPGAEWSVPSMELIAPVERISARDGALVGIFPVADTLAWVEPQSGKILEQVKVPNLRDVALWDAQTALALSGNSVVKVGRDGSNSTVISDLIEPTRLAWDAASKTLWVVEGGTSQQIKRFGADFKWQATLGRAGGRKQGLYRAEDFLHVSGIDGDGHGGFVICEADSAPRRTSHFDRDGKPLREWYGGQQFYTFAAPEPDDPSLVWMDSHWGYLMQVKLDYAKKDWSVRACYRWDSELDPQFFGHGKMARRMFPIRLDLKGDGRKETYLWSDAHFGLLLKVDEAAGLLRPVAGMGVLDTGGYPPKKFEQLPMLWQEAAKKHAAQIPNDQANRLLRGFAWADGNNDYRMQGDELRLLPSDGHGFGGSSSPCQFLDDALNLYQARGYHGENLPAWSIFPAQGRTQSGAPIWDWKHSVAGSTSPFPSTVSLLKSPDGAMFTISQAGGDGYVALDTYGGAHGYQWPANQLDANAVCKWDKTGKLLWRVGPHASRQRQQPGELHCPVFLAGRANGAIGVCDKIISPCEFWSEDGLYIGGLLDRRSDDGLPARAYAWWRENLSDSDHFENLAAFQYDMALGGSLASLPNGDAVFFGCGWNNVPVYRVKGWDQIQRQQGVIPLTSDASHAVLNGHGLAGEYFSTEDFSGEPILRKVAPRVWFEPARNGFAWPAKDVKSARWKGTVEPRFSEDYTLSIYAKGRVRLWLGGKLLLDASSKTGAFHKSFAEPVRLLAGQRYALQAEWTGPTDGQCHLNWESLSQSIEHLPTAALGSELPGQLPVVSVKADSSHVDRPADESSGRVATWTVSRTGATTQPLVVSLDWLGSAKVRREYEPLPSTVTIPAGKTEVSVSAKLLPSKTIAPQRDLTLSLAVTSHYLQDGTPSAASIAIRDARSRKLDIAHVTVSGSPTKRPNERLNEASLSNLINGSGLNRQSDPPQHDIDIKHVWYADGADANHIALTFDVGQTCELSDLRVWNVNTRSAHGLGWGQGPTVRDAARQIRVSVSAAADGPWTDLGEFKLHEPPGDQPDPGDLIPLSQTARFVRLRFARPHDTQTVGLAEVELFGAPR
ncbi:MAG: PA14 domain-containing protein [Planctomycetia bacterium]